jgi:hypothetical protein
MRANLSPDQIRSDTTSVVISVCASPLLNSAAASDDADNDVDGVPSPGAAAAEEEAKEELLM